MHFNSYLISPYLSSFLIILFSLSCTKEGQQWHKTHGMFSPNLNQDHCAYCLDNACSLTPDGKNIVNSLLL